MDSRETGRNDAKQTSSLKSDPVAIATGSLREWIAACAWLIIGIVVLIETSSLKMMSEFGPGPGFLSVCLGILLLALASLQLLTLIRRWFACSAVRCDAVADGVGVATSLTWVRELSGRVRRLTRNGPLLRFILIAGSLLIYGIILEPVGFLIATSLLCGSVLVMLGRAPIRAALEGVVAVLFLYGAFTLLLRVQLPTADLKFLKALGL